MWQYIANMQRKLLLNKRIILSVACLCAGVCSTVLMAQSSHYNVHNKRVHHYLTLGLQGGEANTFAASAEQKIAVPPFHTGYNLLNLPGGDAQFELSYEIRKRNFFFGILGDAHYTITGQRLGSFRDEYRCTDTNGDPMDYRFNYSNFREYQQTVWVGGGIRFGYYFTPRFYAALGGKVEYPLWNTFKTKTNLQTSGYWPFAYGDVESKPGESSWDYGFFSQQPFEYSGKYMVHKTHLIVSPYVEIGTRFNLARRVDLRLAGYVEYGIPIQPEYKSVVLDYSNVKMDPYWQNREQLWATLKTGSILDFAGQKHDYSRLCVGVKLAFLFDVTVYVPHCTTCIDDSGIEYVQPQKQRRRQSTRVYGAYRGRWSKK